MDDRDIQRIISPELAEGEKLLWAGCSNPAKLLTKVDWGLIPLSIIFCGFIALWIVLTSSAWLPVLLASPLYIFGFYLLIGRFFAKAYNKKHTIYAVTDNRVLWLKLNRRGEKKKSMSSSLISVLAESASIRRDGNGSLIFGEASFETRLTLNTGMEFIPFDRPPDTLAFFDVDNADQVLEIFKKARFCVRR